MYVGIIPNDYNMYGEFYIVLLHWIDHIYYNGIGYLYNCMTNRFFYHNPQSPNEGGGFTGQREIKQKIDCGYTIEMTVDLTENNASISYIVNGVDSGIVYDGVLKNKSYRLCVTASGMQPDTEIELI